MSRRRIAIALTLLPLGTFALDTRALAQSGGVFPEQQIPIASTPTSVVVVDLDGDGVVDLATLTTGVEVRLGEGGGAFGPATLYPMGSLGFGLVLVDLDGDGALDAANANFLSNDVTVRLGDGAGGFGALASFSLGAQMASFAVGDLTGDGHADVFATTPGQMLLSIGDGAGGFAAPVARPLPEAFATRLVDVDGDGDLDGVALTTAVLPSGLRVLRNGGGGLLAAEPVFESGGIPAAFTLGDLDGDGDLDAAVLNDSLADHLFVLSGDGAGGFAITSSQTFDLPLGTMISSEVADLDEDGALDLVVTTNANPPGVVRTLAGTGTGTFTNASPVATDGQPFALAVADANGDSHLDLVLAQLASIGQPTAGGTVRIRFGDGAGGFATPSSFGAGGQVVQLLAGDLDRDGHLDLVAPHVATTGILLGDGASTFGAATTIATGGQASLGDLNGDSALDLVSTSATTVTIRLGDRAGSFGAPASFPAPSNTGTALALGDVDLDGDLDAVATVTSGLTNAQILALPGDGAGSFGTASASAVPFGAAGPALLRDVNGDGRLDTISSSTVHVAVSLGDGAGGFPTSALWDTPTGILSSFGVLGAGDLDGDGHVDVAYAVQTFFGPPFENGTWILRGDGAGGVAQSTLVNTGTPRAVAIADVTGDGRADLVTATNVGAVRVQAGLGGLALAPAVDYSPASPTTSMAIADFDGNGRLDVVTANANLGTLSYLPNVKPLPSGLAEAGIGTPGCTGVHGIAATSAPAIGNADFAILTTGVPSSSLGLMLLADAADPVGHDVFGIGVIEHLNFFASTLLLGFDAFGDVVGYGRAPLPIPNAPHFVGVTVYVQTKWLWLGAGACSPSLFGLSSSKLLSITLQ